MMKFSFFDIFTSDFWNTTNTRSHIADTAFTFVDPDPTPESTQYSTLTKSIDQGIIDTIATQQKIAYRASGLNIDSIECCVCYEDAVNFAPISCMHDICTNCHEHIISASCPICRQPMEIVKPHELFAVLTTVKYNRLSCCAFVYFPPIPVNDTWQIYDIYYDLVYNSADIKAFGKTIETIRQASYVVILNDPTEIDRIIDLDDYPTLKKLIY